MIVGEFDKISGGLGPPGAAWEKDNVGLQIGSRGGNHQKHHALS